MAATGIGNPAGFVPLTDGGAPRMIGGLARENISGGVFVFGSTATGVVSSGLNSFITSDILFAKDASGAQFNGVAVRYIGSNTYGTIATRGLMILTCNGTIVGGAGVKCDGNNSVAPLGSTSNSLINSAAEMIGRAVVDGASGGYVIVDLGA